MPNLSTFLDVNARYHASPALVFPARSESYTYTELLERVNALGNGLFTLGIGKGDRVCIYLDSSPEYLISYLAIWKVGGVAVPTNIAYRERELLHAIADSDARIIITDENGAETVSKIRPQAPALEHMIVTGRAPAGAVSWGELLAGSRRLSAVHCSVGDLCQLQYTAGTTGTPKGAMLTHGNWMAALDAEREVLELSPDDVYLGIYPLGHVGFSWGLAALKAGGTFVILERFSLERYLELASRYRVTVLAAMPPVIHTLLHAPAGTENALQTVRVMISGGGPLHPSVWEGFDHRYGIPIANAYGLSETIVVGSATCVPPRQYGLHLGYRSVGIPVGYAEVKIVEEGDPSVEMAAGAIGEVTLRGPAIASGYWKMPEETAEAFLPGGWFLTGDLGSIDEKGVLSITDRKKDMICMSGWKIYPAEVENVLIQHPKVLDAAIFACPDERRGEIPIAAVVLGENESLRIDELASFCRDRLAGYKIPREMVVVSDLPRANGWKLLRRTLREEFSKRIYQESLQ